jgi:Sulfotransferase family
MTGPSTSSQPLVRRVFLLGCPRSRTTVAQTVISQACALVTISTNWWLTSSGTRLLNGSDGEPREVTRPFAQERVKGRLAEAGVALPEEFGVEAALDRLAVEAGAVGWLEKTPLHVLALDEIESEVTGARFVHLVREPGEVVASFLRRAAANPGMRGAAWQGMQGNCEEIWRACVLATLERHNQANHVLVDSEAFVDDPEAVAKRIARFAEVPYRAPDDPGRIAQAGAVEPSVRPWKRDAVGPVRRIEHEDQGQVGPLAPQTVELWQQVRELMNPPNSSTGSAAVGVDR